MKNLTLSIKAITWNRESHGLFDYENSQTTINTLKTKAPVKILQSDLGCEFIGDTSYQSDKVLLEVIESDKEFYVQAPKQERL